METTDLKNKSKALKKRFLYFGIFFCFVLTFTLLTKTTPFEELTKEELTLSETPQFIVKRDVSSKQTDIDYFIVFKFKELKDSLTIGLPDLHFAERSAIKNELIKGDTLLVHFHADFHYISQLNKKGKEYMYPTKAYEESNKIELAVLLSSLFALIICLTGFILSNKNRTHLGWISAVIIFVATVFIFLVMDITLTVPSSYPEFN